MTTARQIIDDALTFRLNRLGPGESADSTTDAVCLRALNSIVDEMNGSDSLLWREGLITSSSAISAATAQMTAFSGLAVGDRPLSLSWSEGSGGNQYPMSEITMQQYQDIPDKATTGQPDLWAYDGLTFYFWPVPTSHYMHVRTKVSATSFADATTDYTMPAGYRSYFTDALAERIAPIMGGLTPAIAAAAAAARRRILAQNLRPAIVDTAACRPFDITRGY